MTAKIDNQKLTIHKEKANTLTKEKLEIIRGDNMVYEILKEILPPRKK